MTERQLTSQNGLIQKSLKGTRYRWERRNDSKGKHDAPRYYDGVIWVYNNKGFPTEVKLNSFLLTENEEKRFEELQYKCGISCLIINYNTKYKIWNVMFYDDHSFTTHEKLVECLNNRLEIPWDRNSAINAATT